MYQVPPQQPPIHAVPPDVIFGDSFGSAAQDPELEQLLAPPRFPAYLDGSCTGTWSLVMTCHHS